MRVDWGKWFGTAWGCHPEPAGSTPASLSMDDKRYYTRTEVADMFDVSTATVSGWLERGVLSGVKVTHVWHIDKGGVDSMRESLMELGTMERNAAALKGELDSVIKERYEIIMNARRDNGMLRFTPSFVELVGSFADVMGIGDKEKSRQVLLAFVGGIPTKDIAEDLGLTTSRVRQILYSSFARLRKFPDYTELKRELSECHKRLDEARVRINGLKSAVSAYEELDKNIMRGTGEITVARVFLASLDDIGLTRRAVNGLGRVGVKVNGINRKPKNLGQLVQITADEIRSVRTLGRKTLYEINDRLESMGLHLGMSIDGMVSWSRGRSELVNISKNDIDFHRI